MEDVKEYEEIKESEQRCRRGIGIRWRIKEGRDKERYVFFRGWIWEA